ncbi:NADAR domain-containing protein [Aeromonas sp. 23P]|uniref:NADAR domain-containing protein n=1 Tax=Aeromonas sp. 23P TaxID=3452716 RepID=UPI003F7AA946|nr:DUF1768 domain-containing protein [Aeromonas veronii]
MSGKTGISNADDFIFFFREFPSDSDYYFCSQWYAKDFEYKGNVFKSSEHLMMFYKAVFFKDYPMAEKILACNTPREAKALGKLVSNYVDPDWLAVNKRVISLGTKEKFLQDHESLERLLYTNGRVLVEASPFDDLYGIKLRADDPKAKNPFLWQGQNLLGEVITKFRDDALSGRLWATVDLTNPVYAKAKEIVDAYLTHTPYQKTVYQVRGDLLKAFENKEVDVLIHSCHCFNYMGVGFAQKVANLFPEAAIADRQTIKGDVGKLGTYSVARLEDGSAIVNAYAQYGYGKDGVRADEILNNERDVAGRDPDRPHVSYDCLRKILTNVNKEFKGRSVGLPTIGSDLGRSDWRLIQSIIKETLTDVDVKIFYYHQVMMKKRFNNGVGFGMG